ncbi:MAG: GH116 family glycosyl hydrolase, partial [Candidatus Brocadiia bacterium]|nr:GH116 family glycosyl hydrolase [Candidatus Brocadiia bacterium]
MNDRLFPADLPEREWAEFDGGGFHGLSVESNQASYVLGVIGEHDLRVGGELGMDETAWSIIEHRLPYASKQGGATVAVDFSLAAGEEKVVRYVLAWYSPEWKGSGSMSSDGNSYGHMYASRYTDALEVARLLAGDHESLLKRTLAWQEAIQRDPEVPPWLRDSLVNILHLITETSTWAQAKPPIGDWCRPEEGIFALNESPRSCPDQEILCNSFFGNAPLVYFYPELAMSSLRAYKANQFPSGQVPWMLGGVAAGDPPSPPFDLVCPATGFAKPMTTLDGPCYVDMVDRMWMQTGDDEILREFYESIKKNTVFTMNLRPGSGAAGIVSMPADNDAQVWVEAADLFGIVPHIGGVHLAQLRTAGRMAEAMGDAEFVGQCQEWLEQGSGVLEEHAWAGSHYVLYNELETGKRSDVVLSAQLEGEWMTLFHGLEGVFRPDRVDTTLETIKNTSMALSEIGAVAFSMPDGRPLEETDWNPGYWGSTGEHVPSTFMLAATYMYKGRRDVGLELARRTVDANMRRGAYWDWPSNMFPMPFPLRRDGRPVHVGMD